MSEQSEGDSHGLSRRSLLRSGAVLGTASGFGAATSGVGQARGVRSGRSASTTSTAGEFVVEQGGEEVGRFAPFGGETVDSALSFYDGTDDRAPTGLEAESTSRLFVHESQAGLSLGVVHDAATLEAGTTYPQTVDDFESGGLSAYRNPTGGNWERVTDAGLPGEGSRHLADTGFHELVSLPGDGLNHYPGCGEVVEGAVKFGSGDDVVLFLGVQDQADTGPLGGESYGLRFSTIDDQIGLFKQEADGNRRDFDSVRINVERLAGLVLVVRVEWHTGGDLRAVIETADGLPVASLDGTDDADQPLQTGGIGFRAGDFESPVEAWFGQFVARSLSDDPTPGGGGAATFDFGDSLPAGEWVVTDGRVDDDGDGTVEWQWESTTVGGGMYTGLGSEFAVTVDPEWTAYDCGHISGWEVVDGESGDVAATLDLDAPVTIRAGASSAEVSVTNLRLVETVEDTRVVEGRGSDRTTVVGPDALPPADGAAAVAGRNASVAFDLSASGAGALSAPMELTVERELRDGSDASVSRSDAVSIPPGDLRDVMEGTATVPDVLAANDAPVFAVDDGATTLQRVTVSLSGGGAGAEATLERGVDFDVAASRALRVGFVPVADPAGGGNYGGGSGGTPADYDALVADAVATLERTLPVTDVVAYEHVEPVVGHDLAGDGTALWAARADLAAARDVLEEQLPVERAATRDGNGAISADAGFDATVLVVPSGYFRHHLGEDRCGAHLDGDATQPQAAAVVRDDCGGAAVAQAVGHQLLASPYAEPTATDPPSPMARRAGGVPSGADCSHPGLDCAHARRRDSTTADGATDPPGVVSRTFDLADGSYAVREGVPSVMSDADGPVGADERLYQRLVDGDFTPSPPEADDGAARQPVLSGVGSFGDDGSASLGYLRTRPGVPMADAGDGAVTVTVTGHDGDVLASATTTDSLMATFDDGTDRIADALQFTVPFPADATTVRVERDGTATRLDPLSGLLLSALRRVPAAGFVRDPEELRAALASKLRAVEEQLAAGAYRGAHQKLVNDVTRSVERWLAADYEASAGEVTRDEFLALVADVVERLAAIADDRVLEEARESGIGPGGGTGRDGRGRGRD